MKTTVKPLHFPDTPGPWGVNTIGASWAVIHAKTGRSKVIGPVVGVSRRRRPNYFDRAMEEADRRNKTGR